MRTKLIISLLLLVFSLMIFSQALTEKEVLEQIEMETARLQAAEMKLEECKPMREGLESKYNKLVTTRDELKAELGRLKESRGFYTVKWGDWLSKLAEYPEVYGKGNWRRWPEIYNANKRLIKDPNLIYPNWKLIIPRP